MSDVCRARPPPRCALWLACLPFLAAGLLLLTQASPAAAAAAAAAPDWAHLTQASLQAVTAQEFADASPTDIGLIPGNACPALAATQVAALSSESSAPQNGSCAGFQSADVRDCVGQMPPEVFASVNAQCMTSFSAGGMAEISADGWMHLPPNILAYATAAGISQVTTGCAGMTPQQMASLGSQPTANTCAGISAGCFASIQPQVQQSLTVACVQALPAAAFTQLSPQAVGNTSATIASYWTMSQLEQMNPQGCAGLTASQIDNWGSWSPFDTCSGLTAACLRNIDANQLVGSAGTGGTGLSEDCVQVMSAPAFAGFTSAQVSLLPAGEPNNIVRDITAAQFAYLTPIVCAAWSGPQASQFGLASTGACAGITADCFAYLPSTVFPSLPPTCIRDASDEAFSHLSAVDTQTFTLPQMAHLRAPQLANLGPGGAACAGFNATMFASVVGSTCAGLNVGCASNFAAPTVAGMTQVCVLSTPAATFSTWTESQASYFLPSVVGAFSANQTAQLQNGTCAAFTPAMVAALSSADASACAGLTPGCWENVNKDSWGAFSSACVVAARVDALSHAQANQLELMTPAAIGALSAAQLAQMNPVACGGLSANQTAAFGSVDPIACAGLQAACVDAMNNAAISGLSGSCVGSAPSNSFADLTAGQVSHLSDAAVAAISAAQIMQLPAASCSGFSAEQVALLNASQTCLNVSAACFSHMAVDTFAGLQTACVAAASPGAFSQIDAEQLGELQPSAVAQLSVLQVSQIMSATCAGFDVNQVARLAASCAGISSACAMRISGFSMSSMQSACLLALPSPSFGVLSYYQVANVSAATLSYLNASQLQALSTGSCAAFSAAQVAALGSNNAIACSGFRADCLAALTAPAIGGLQPVCVTQSAASAFVQISEEQVATLSPAATGALSASQLAAIMSPSCRGWNSNQTVKWGAGCTGLLFGCIERLSDDAVSGVQAACMFYVAPSEFGAWRRRQVEVLAVSTVAAVSAAQWAAVHNASCSGLGVAQVAGLGTNLLTLNACVGLRGDCLHYVNGSSFANVTGNCATQIPPLSFGDLDAQQIGLFPDATMAALTPAQIAATKGTTCAGISVSQLAAMSDGCAGLQISCVAALGLQTLAGLGGACMALIPNPSFLGWSSEQVAAWPFAVIGSINASQIAVLPASQCGAFSAGQVTQFGLGVPDMCGGLAPTCVQMMAPPAFAGFTQLCFTTANAGILSLVSPAQVAQLAPGAAGAINRMQFGSIASAACGGFNATHTASFGALAPGDSCAGVTAGCAQALTGAAIGGIQGACVDLLPALVFGAWSAPQIPFFTPAAVAHITDRQALNLTSDNCPGFTGVQSPAFSAAFCSALPIPCATSLTDNAWANVAATCWVAVVGPTLGYLSAHQMAAVAPTVFALTTDAQMLFLGSQQCAGLMDTQLAALTSPSSNVCESMTANCSSALSVASVTGMPPPCVGALPLTALTPMNVDQLAAFNIGAIGALSSAQFFTLWQLRKTSLINAWSVAQGNALSRATLVDFILHVENGTVRTSQQWGPATNFSLISAIQVADAAVDQVQFLFMNSKTVAALPVQSWAGWRGSQMMVLGVSASAVVKSSPVVVSRDATVGSISWITDPLAWASMQADAVSAVSPAQLPFVVPGAFAGLPIADLNPASIPSLNTAQMQAIPMAAYGTLTCAEFAAFTPSQISTLADISPAQLQALQTKCGDVLPSSTAAAMSSTGAESSSSGADDDSTGSAPTDDKPSSGLSTGELAGILAGSIVGVGALLALAICLCRRRRSGGSSSKPFEPLLPSDSETAASKHRRYG